jgi:hypothetical protein
MAAQGHVEDSFTFVGGLNTEGAFFLTPKNCWKEGDNVIPQTDGSVERRKALVVETGGTLLALSAPTNKVYTTHKWTSVSGNGSVNFVVVQVGKMLYFYNSLSGAVSNRYIGQIDIAGFQAVGNTDLVDVYPVQTAVAFGDLIVTHQSCDPFFVRYNGISLSTDKLILRVRDFAGVYMDTLVTDEFTETEWGTRGLRPAALYNLYNQGWDKDKIVAYQTPTGGLLPANTKSWIYGKDSNDDFSASVLNKQSFGDSAAPKGRVILQLFNQERSFEEFSVFSETAPVENYQTERFFTNSPSGSTTTTLYSNYISARPQACGFFAGRIWYAGIKNSFLNGNIYFTQVATSKEKYNQCFQENDPTSEVFSDILDSDGGVIVIPEVGEIVALRAATNSLLVFATNGVWSITGGDNGFRASAYIVSKVTNVGCISESSIVEVEDTFMFWSVTGIYALKIGQLGEGAAQNVSDANIKSFYNNISYSLKQTVSVTYDYVNKRVIWVYDNKSLVLDLALQAWYTNTFDNTNSVVGVFTTNEAADANQNLNVVVDTTPVLSSADQVVINNVFVNAGVATVKYTTIANNNLTFAEFAEKTFSDWGLVEVPAYLITGYTMGNNGPARQKTAGYMSVFMKRTESAFDAFSNPIDESGCFLQTRWDFTDNSNPGKWGQEYQVYRLLRPYLVSGSGAFDDGYPLVITKNKIRGRGKGLQIKLAAEAGKDMKLVGWSMTFVGNTNV